MIKDIASLKTTSHILNGHTSESSIREILCMEKRRVKPLVAEPGVNRSRAGTREELKREVHSNCERVYQ